MRLDCLVENAAGHIKPFNRVWNAVVVCDTLPCIVNKQQNVNPLSLI